MTPRQNLESKSMVWKFTDNNNALHCVAILRAMHWQLKTEKEKMLQVKNPKVKSKIQHSTKSVAVKLYQMYCCFSVLPLYPATTRWRQKTQKKKCCKSKMQNPKSKSVLWNCSDSIAALQCCHPPRHALAAKNTAITSCAKQGLFLAATYHAWDHP